MNDELQNFARAALKKKLSACSESEQRVFKLMYGRGKPKAGTIVPSRSVVEAEAMFISDIVDEMPQEKLDWAMQQLTNTLEEKSSGQ